jgi:hypothetical protein
MYIINTRVQVNSPEISSSCTVINLNLCLHRILLLPALLFFLEILNKSIAMNVVKRTRAKRELKKERNEQ